MNPAGPGLGDGDLNQRSGDTSSSAGRVHGNLIDLVPPSSVAERVLGVFVVQRQDVAGQRAVVLRDPDPCRSIPKEGRPKAPPFRLRFFDTA